MKTTTIGDGKIRRRGQRQEQLPSVDTDSGGLGFRFRSGSAAFRVGAVSSGFRHRVLRRAWRPMLLTIPE
ncbi:hypothetical protein SESBI_20169 [Sesbania bispinosa]|nr:hypothetical protein SESBI_20169 [Sesbania bispinosa]